jgi:hypothetical protein
VIWPRYSGLAHFALSNLLLGGVTALALSGLRDLRPAELLAVPVAFLAANLVEYLAHRYPLHHPRPLFYAYRNHTLGHHRFFTAEREEFMVCNSSRDFFVILFGPVSLSLLIVGIGAPLALLAWAVAGHNAGLLFFATAVGYFLLYEWLHLVYHLPVGARLPGVRALRRHHLAHHDLRLMTHWNFNITFPLFDALLGTTWRPGQQPARPAAPEVGAESR